LGSEGSAGEGGEGKPGGVMGVVVVVGEGGQEIWWTQRRRVGVWGGDPEELGV
jgi:hypothetical protein